MNIYSRLGKAEHLYRMGLLRASNSRLGSTSVPRAALLVVGMAIPSPYLYPIDRWLDTEVHLPWGKTFLARLETFLGDFRAC